MRMQEWMPRLLACGAVAVALSSTGCKTLSERYIALEVWKYERCFGHLPPGFVPPGAAQPVAAPPRICGQGAPCAQAQPCAQTQPCAGGETVVGDNCNSCQGGMVDGGLPAGTTIVPGSSTIHQGGSPLPGGAGAPMLPAGPGGAPGPVPSASTSIPTIATPVSSSRPVVISDEVVLP